VTIEFLDEDKSRTKTYLISTQATDETRGVLSICSPLGRALLHAAVEDEIEFEVDGGVRQAIVLAIHPRPALLAAE
jgi:transcription elongation GreA/GreB family factor